MVDDDIDNKHIEYLDRIDRLDYARKTVESFNPDLNTFTKDRPYLEDYKPNNK